MVDQHEFLIAEVVVDRFWNTDADNIQPVLLRKLAHPVCRIHGVIPANIEEEADSLRTKDINNPLQIFDLFRSYLVAAGSDRSSSRRGT